MFGLVGTQQWGNADAKNDPYDKIYRFDQFIIEIACYSVCVIPTDIKMDDVSTVTFHPVFKASKHLSKSNLPEKALQLTLAWQEPPKMAEKIFEKIWFDSFFDFLSLVHVPSTNMEEVYDLQGAIKTLWLHFCRVVKSSIFIYSLWLLHFRFLCGPGDLKTNYVATGWTRMRECKLRSCRLRWLGVRGIKLTEEYLWVIALPFPNWGDQIISVY